jgi:hypothetical protein
VGDHNANVPPEEEGDLDLRGSVGLLDLLADTGLGAKRHGRAGPPGEEVACPRCPAIVAGRGEASEGAMAPSGAVVSWVQDGAARIVTVPRPLRLRLRLRLRARQ